MKYLAPLLLGIVFLFDICFAQEKFELKDQADGIAIG